MFFREKITPHTRLKKLINDLKPYLARPSSEQVFEQTICEHLYEMCQMEEYEIVFDSIYSHLLEYLKMIPDELNSELLDLSNKFGYESSMDLNLKVEAVLNPGKFGLDYPPSIESVEKLMDSDNRILAIKMYRELMDCDIGQAVKDIKELGYKF